MSGGLQVSFEELRCELRVDAVIAAIVFLNAAGAIRAADDATVEKNVFALLDERTAQRGDDQGVAGGIVFGVVGRADAEDVASVFEDHVLEAATRSEEWDLLLARIADRFEYAFGICIGRSRNDPEAVEMAELLLRIQKRGTVNPGTLNGNSELRGGELQGFRDRAVGGDLGVVVAHEGDAAVLHARNVAENEGCR